MRLALLIPPFAAACARQPPPVTPIAIVSWPQTPRPSCPLPILPNPVTVVGWPTGDKIYVTKDDLQSLITYNAEISSFLSMVQSCLNKIGAP
jgi:hypothetical protein